MFIFDNGQTRLHIIDIKKEKELKDKKEKMRWILFEKVPKDILKEAVDRLKQQSDEWLHRYYQNTA